jgi:hypothetical protein
VKSEKAPRLLFRFVETQTNLFTRGTAVTARITARARQKTRVFSRHQRHFRERHLVVVAAVEKDRLLLDPFCL